MIAGILLKAVLRAYSDTSIFAERFFAGAPKSHCDRKVPGLSLPNMLSLQNPRSI